MLCAELRYLEACVAHVDDVLAHPFHLVAEDDCHTAVAVGTGNGHLIEAVELHAVLHLLHAPHAVAALAEGGDAVGGILIVCPVDAVLTSEALPTNDNTNCFKITTAAGTYYVGKNFCMTEAEWLAPAAPVSTGMIAGFTGRYTNGRAQMEIAAKDNGTASVIVSWAGSAFDTTVWTMSGTVSTVGDNLVITYSDCTKETTSYTADGTLNQDLIEYMNGTGTICIDTNDSTVVWADAQENAADGEIFFRPVA